MTARSTLSETADGIAAVRDVELAAFPTAEALMPDDSCPVPGGVIAYPSAFGV
ncbi:hypothetical protein [Actinocorallia libanotica]|uniref:Uncharacterized protein n=1 Tax=Actinocorallia libanotica TaxID=46162 RepID=A0ABN1RDY7_9ACTN